jgi:hypothetical protein
VIAPPHFPKRVTPALAVSSIVATIAWGRQGTTSRLPEFDFEHGAKGQIQLKSYLNRVHIRVNTVSVSWTSVSIDGFLDLPKG